MQYVQKYSLITLKLLWIIAFIFHSAVAGYPGLTHSFGERSVKAELGQAGKGRRHDSEDRSGHHGVSD